MNIASPISEPWFALAQGPRWDVAAQRLMWVDILEEACFVGRFERDRIVVETQHQFETYVGSVVKADNGALLVAEHRQLTRVLPSAVRDTTGPINLVGRHDRFNDGVCDARGRFLVGTVSLTGTHHSQLLIQVAQDGIRVLDDDLGMSDGLAFSPDGSTMYSVDRVPGTVWRRDYDQATGATGPRALLLDLSDCAPNGLCVDELGRLWIAIWGQGQVRCYSERGELVQLISVPAPHTTSVAFAGPDLDRLVITTARAELSKPQLIDAPMSGSLFVADPGCRGLAPHRWSGLIPAPALTSIEAWSKGSTTHAALSTWS
jgi:sugar lactone lactonase YvrE